MAKTDNLYIRIEPEIKEQAEKILDTLGISVSGAVKMFFNQIILQGGIPFDLKIPKPLNMSEMTEEEIDAAIEKGLEDIREGRVQTLDEMAAELEEEFGL